MEEITRITQSLYADLPEGVLYHYTTFTGLLGIVEKKALWASDIRYMNDSAELKHTADLIRIEVQQRITRGHANPDLLALFVDWVSYRITNGNILFGTSFRSHGNLLSQWRGYSLPGKGVSLGFSSEQLSQCAENQFFQFGRCIYEPARQRALISQVVDAVENYTQESPVGNGATRREEAKGYEDIFAHMEIDLLRIAAILKHPSFQEEEEWRLVSPVLTNYADSSVLFREGKSMLVPYVEFNLVPGQGGSLSLDHLYLGPTPNVTISMNSLRMFLAKNGIVPKRGIDFCDIPFRQR